MSLIFNPWPSKLQHLFYAVPGFFYQCEFTKLPIGLSTPVIPPNDISSIHRTNGQVKVEFRVCSVTFTTEEIDGETVSIPHRTVQVENTYIYDNPNITDEQIVSELNDVGSLYGNVIS